jgi:argininosuccinate lyase
MAGMVGDLTVERERMRAAAGAGYATATDVADWLVRMANVPFREAHHITGRLVARAEEKGCGLEGLTIEDFKAIDPRIDSRIHKVLGVENSVRSRTSYGGTAPSNVLMQVARWKELLTGEKIEARKPSSRGHAHGEGATE